MKYFWDVFQKMILPSDRHSHSTYHSTFILKFINDFCPEELELYVSGSGLVNKCKSSEVLVILDRLIVFVLKR
jgi:hypothetical protein